MSYSQKYKQQQFIGRGQYGKVYLAISQSHQLNVAKKIQLQGMSPEQIEGTMKQVEIHRSLHHPNIIEFKESFLQERTLIVIMEYCQYGDLSFYIKKCKDSGQPFEEKVIMNLFMQLLFGLNYLHENMVLHRDLKTSNIFVNANGQLKLGDFGISKVMEHTLEVAMTLVGTPFYLSPEMCKNEGYTFKSDVWALGCILYELCTLQKAFDGNNVLVLAKKIVNDQVENISPNYSQDLNNLIKLLLEKDPNDRPLIRDLFQHKLIKQYTNKFTNTKGNFHQVSSEPKRTPQKARKTQNKRYTIIETTTELNTNYDEEDMLYKNRSQSADDFIEISPMKSRNSVQILSEKCELKMGKQLFIELYSLMRNLKKKGLTEIQVESQIRKRYSKSQFNYAMDVAQLIYVEDTQ